MDTSVRPTAALRLTVIRGGKTRVAWRSARAQSFNPSTPMTSGRRRCGRARGVRAFGAGCRLVLGERSTRKERVGFRLRRPHRGLRRREQGARRPARGRPSRSHRRNPLLVLASTHRCDPHPGGSAMADRPGLVSPRAQRLTMIGTRRSEPSALAPSTQETWAGMPRSMNTGWVHTCRPWLLPASCISGPAGPGRRPDTAAL
jgi:hypothetical protein